MTPTAVVSLLRFAKRRNAQLQEPDMITSGSESSGTIRRAAINHCIKPQNTVDGLANQDWNILDVSIIICSRPQAFSFAMVSDVLSSTLSLSFSIFGQNPLAVRVLTHVCKTFWWM